MTGFRPDHGGSPDRGQMRRTAGRRARAYAALKKGEEPEGPVRPRHMAQGGVEAALEEYRDFKAAGMLDVWRERWKMVLHHD